MDGAEDQGRSAKAKLPTLKVGIGYPDTWRDYSALQIVRGDAFGNAERAEMFDYRVPPREAGPAARPQRVVDDAADGQRGEPAAAERA